MFHRSEAEEQAYLLLQLSNGGGPNQILQNANAAFPGNTGNVQPSPPAPSSAATTLSPYNPSTYPFETYLYHPSQLHGAPPEQRLPLGGIEGPDGPRQQKPDIQMQPAVKRSVTGQQEHHEPMFDMGMDARSGNQVIRQPTSLYLNRVTVRALSASLSSNPPEFQPQSNPDFNRSANQVFNSIHPVSEQTLPLGLWTSLAENNNLLYPQSNLGSSRTSPARPRGHGDRRHSHSAEAIHRARIAMTTNAYAPVNTYDPSQCCSFPVRQAMVPSTTLQVAASSQRFQIDPYNTSPTEQPAGVPSYDHITPKFSVKAESNERVSSRAPAPASSSSSKQGLSPPEKTSWMYGIDTAHPSMQATEDGEVPASKAIPPDTKTKRSPIREEDVTRYDILSGRGGKTNHHEGNKKFRRLVSLYKKDYFCAKKPVKGKLVSRIVNFVRQGQGRFLQKEKDGFWYEIGDVRACAKLSQSMREGTPVSAICREIVGEGPLPPETTKEEELDISQDRSQTEAAPFGDSDAPNFTIDL